MVSCEGFIFTHSGSAVAQFTAYRDDLLSVQALENGTGRVSPTQRSYLTGTFAYRAPELLKGDSPTTKADIYSLGVTLWQMRSGELPYAGQNQHVVVFGVVAYDLRPETGTAASKAVQTDGEQKFAGIYRQCWGSNPLVRPTSDDIKHALIELKNFE